MKLLFKCIAIAMAFPMALMATNPKLDGRYTKEKTLKKEFSVNRDAELSVDNSFGNIDIVTWNENRIVIEVMIKTNGDNEEKVQKKLDNIDVEFSSSASNVIARTLFKSKKNSSWSFWGNDQNNVKMEINYTIKMPITNSVDLSNDYGSINLNKLEGVAKISCDYGQINIGQLMADNNSLNFDYTKNSTIGYMKSGKINADYSSFTIDKIDNLDLNADYTHSEIDEVKSIIYNNDYGKIEINKVDKLMGRGDYIPLHVKTLTGSLNVNTDYGGVTVDRMASSAKEVTINSDYAGIQLGYDSDYSFSFKINLNYASLSGEDDLEMLNTSKDNSSKSYIGYHGSKNSGNTITINSDYGGVKLQKK
jgi:hypothetical protein